MFRVCHVRPVPKAASKTKLNKIPGVRASSLQPASPPSIPWAWQPVEAVQEWSAGYHAAAHRNNRPSKRTKDPDGARARRLLQRLLIWRCSCRWLLSTLFAIVPSAQGSRLGDYILALAASCDLGRSASTRSRARNAPPVDHP